MNREFMNSKIFPTKFGWGIQEAKMNQFHEFPSIPLNSSPVLYCWIIGDNSKIHHKEISFFYCWILELAEITTILTGNLWRIRIFEWSKGTFLFIQKLILVHFFKKIENSWILCSFMNSPNFSKKFYKVLSSVQSFQRAYISDIFPMCIPFEIYPEIFRKYKTFENPNQSFMKSFNKWSNHLINDQRVIWLSQCFFTLFI